MKKILSITMLLIILTSLFYNSNAFEFGTKELSINEWCSPYFTYEDSLVRVVYVVYKNGNSYLPAYCLDPNLSGVGSSGDNTYNVVANGKITDEKAWKVLINCYPYRSLSELGVESEEEAYYASNIAVMTALGTRNKDSFKAREYSPASLRVYDAYLKILEWTNAETRTFSSDCKIAINSQENWQVEGEYLSKTYILSSSASGTGKLELSGNLPSGSKMVNSNGEEIKEITLGENFKILVPVNKLDEVYEFSIKATSTLKTYPIYYGKTTVSGTQNYALVGETNENVVGCLTDKTIKNTTKITVIKKEYDSEKRLTGVTFNLLDSDKNIKYQNLITDDSGEIEISGLLPGKYFLQETETLEGYNIYEDLIEIDVSLNEEVEVVVNNTIKTVEEISKEKENIEVVEVKKDIVQKNETTQTTIEKLPVTGY